MDELMDGFVSQICTFPLSVHLPSESFQMAFFFFLSSNQKMKEFWEYSKGFLSS